MADIDTCKTKHAAESRHAVRFPDNVSDSVNKIHVLKFENSSKDVEVHAGFFKVDHKYEVVFELDDTVGLGDVPTVEIPSEVHITLRDVHRNNSGIILTIEYFPTGMDGVANEMFTLRSQDGSKEMRGVFRAEVLGHGQGTPMLKDGVRCIRRSGSTSSSGSR